MIVPAGLRADSREILIVPITEIGIYGGIQRVGKVVLEFTKAFTAASLGMLVDEARLIIAEAQGGQTAVDIINAFHSRAGIPAFTGGSAEQIRAQVSKERRRELFLEGHHLGDMIRYNLPFRPATGTVFPAPTHGNPKGGTYGSTRCLPLPNVERFNNPLIPSA